MTSACVLDTQCAKDSVLHKNVLNCFTLLHTALTSAMARLTQDAHKGSLLVISSRKYTLCARPTHKCDPQRAEQPTQCDLLQSMRPAYRCGLITFLLRLSLHRSSWGEKMHFLSSMHHKGAAKKESAAAAATA